MTGRRLHVGGYQHVICLLHYICVVLQVVTLNILGRSSSVITALDKGSNNDNDDDDGNTTANAGNNETPFKVITGKAIHIDTSKFNVITSSPLNNVSSF